MIVFGMAENGRASMLTDRDVIRVAETGEDLLIFNVTDDALERAAGADGIADGRAMSLVYSTEVAAGCACPV
jgi:hypothetical protein